MLKSHLAAVEATLLALFGVQENVGHSIHKGTPREAFVREFLDKHLPGTLRCGTGEIISANSEPRQPRRQFDVVVYRADYPKLDLGGGINAFLVESVLATIEVKSTLNKAGLRRAASAAAGVKRLKRSISVVQFGYVPPAVLSVIVAYRGPAKMQTVCNWIKAVYEDEHIETPRLPPTGAERLRVASPSLDSVLVLGKGYVAYDNQPFTFMSDEHRALHPDAHWGIVKTDRGALLCLFLALVSAGSGVLYSGLAPGPYARDVRVVQPWIG